MATPSRLGMQSPGADKGVGGTLKSPVAHKAAPTPTHCQGLERKTDTSVASTAVKGIPPGRKNAVTPPVQPGLRISTRPQQHRWLHPIPALLSEFLFSRHYTHSIPPLSTRRLGGHTAVRRVLEQTTGHETGQRLRALGSATGRGLEQSPEKVCV